jgi:hypothetical protein
MADFIHQKAGTEVGATAKPDKSLALFRLEQIRLPTTLQARLATLGALMTVRASPLARHRAKDGYFTRSSKVQRAMPQDVETQAGQLDKKFEKWAIQLFSEQILILLECEQL